MTSIIHRSINNHQSSRHVGGHYGMEQKLELKLKRLTTGLVAKNVKYVAVV